MRAARQNSADEDCECAFCDECCCQDGKEWIRCACSHLVHEECVEDIHLDGDGQEQILSILPQQIHTFAIFSCSM